MKTEQTQAVIIVGAGIAGLSAALACAPKTVLVLCAVDLSAGGSSVWAQGGMAVAVADDDTPELHAADTMTAGAGLNDPAAVDVLTREGPEALRRLTDLGAPFDRKPDGHFVQSLEAAHSRARVARVGGDGAGRAIMQALAAAAHAAPNIEVREQTHVRALVKDAAGAVIGVLAERRGVLTRILGHAVILATGGIGGLYAVTTTPRELLGEGLALAALAGADVSDIEFMQFHPTAIDVGGDPAPLATEALRGEGARLVNADGAPFMHRYDPRAELAPRDVVARAIAREKAAGRGAFLDAREAVGDHFPEEFPAVFAACMAAGIDPRIQPIPVTPAAHYHMGGIVTDLDGRTTLSGLYAAGECASTGVHGANRLASNSLLEGAVFGHRAGQAAARDPHAPDAALSAEPTPVLPPDPLMALRQAMSACAGVVRDAAGLEALLRLIDELEDLYGPALPLVAARLVADGALARHESRGGHYRLDYPDLAQPRRSVVRLADRNLVPA